MPAERNLEPIAFAVVQDAPVSWRSQTWKVPGADGLILHLAGPTDEGVRTISVWESEADWRAFEATSAGHLRTHVRELFVVHLFHPLAQRRAPHA